MKAKTWDNPNKMHIETGHKTFDRQTNIITRGNVIANTEYGWIIRARLDTRCNEKDFPVGHLRAFDLKFFKNMPRPVRSKLMELTDSEDAVWLYEFHHWRGPAKIVDGYTMTAYEDHELLATFTTGPTRRSRSVVHEASKYVCKGDEAEAAA